VGGTLSANSQQQQQQPSTWNNTGMEGINPYTATVINTVIW